MKLLLVQITRNRQGQAARAEQTLEIDVLRIGRGSDCKLHLADPRVALHHATIGRAGDGVCFIEAGTGTLKINGQFERAARLRPSQAISIGPFELIVQEPPEDYDLALSYELLESLPLEVAGGRRRKLRASLRDTWLSKRLMSWFAAAIVLVAFLVWPVMHALNPASPLPDRVAAAGVVLTADASWDPGPLASGHHSFGRDCAKCHATPFVQTKNEQCESCHKSVGWHFAQDTAAKKALHEAVFMQAGNAARCAACHRDHKGPLGLVRQDSPLCIQCHADLKSRAPQTELADIGDFAHDHPPFKLSMLLAGKIGASAVVRVAQDNPKPIESSNLKFPHDVHLSPKGLRGPDGRIVMECKNCHVPDETGTRFKPTTMKDHCQSCHSLEFEPKAGNRQAPHGKVDDVVAAVREFYAQAVLADTPIDVVIQDGVRRPGERLSATQRLSALNWATQKADKITRELMEDRVCFSCHQIKRVEGQNNAAPTWAVAPVAVTQHWLPKARFPHSQHNTHECASCHKVAQSKSSGDIAIPDIGKCRECHGGNATAADRAPGTCETCHGFHVGGSRSGTPVPLPMPKQKATQKVASADSAR